eukprot:gene15535-15682_t
MLPNRPTGHVSAADDNADEADMAVLLLMPEAEAVAGDTPVKPFSGPKSGRHLAILLMLGAILSKGLGFVREISMAHVFGASLIADGFRAAITGTMLPLALLQNESVPTILIPLHRGWQDSGNAPRRFAALTIALTLVGLLIALVVLVLGKLWVGAIVGGFSPEGQAITLDFLQIMALGMPASVMINVLAAGEIALGRSRLTTIRASLLNISVIFGIAVLLLTHWLNALAWAFALAFNGLGFWGVVSLTRDGSLNFRGLRLADVRVAALEFWCKLRPLLAVPVADQGNVWIERVLASRFAIGTVASLDYARTITESAVLFISQPLGLVLLSSAPTSDFGARMEALARPLLAVALPGSICLGIFAPDVARLVFSRGAFNEIAVQLTGEAMRGISFGLWATTLGWVLLRMLNSVGRNTTAALILVAAYLANLLMNLLLANIAAIHAFGPLLLGIGEATRGFVLLGATVLVMGCGMRMLKLLSLSVFPAVLMVLSGWYIDAFFTGTLTRLLVAALACVVVIIVGSFVLVPDMCRRIADQILGARGGLFTFHRGARAARWETLPNRNFYLNLDFLDTVLRHLRQENWDIVTIEEAVRRASAPELGRKFVNFSVDDCYRDTFEEIVPLFREHKAPVTLFVSTGIPDATMTLWGAGLEDALLQRDRVLLDNGWLDARDSAAKRQAYDSIATLWDGPHANACYERFCQLNQIDIAAMHWKHAISWDMLAQIKDDPCVEIGGHTINHPRVSSLAPDAALAELAGCRLRLEEKLGLPVRHFAFPYGRSADCGPRDFDIARQAGFASAATTCKGLVHTGQQVAHLPRITLNGGHQTLAMVEAHLAGLTAMAAKVLGRV